MLGVTALGIILQRGYQTVDIVLQAAENQTVEVIKAVGETSIGIMPVIAGAIVTMILLGLRLVVRRFWPSAKEELCLAGKNPEGNVEAASGSSGAYPSQSDKFPSLPWVTRDLLARAVANLTDASKIAEKPEMATRIRDSPCHLIWKVESQSGARPYYVRLAKTALSRFTVQPMVRDLISCGCPGHTLALKDAEDDRICKHCGAVLLLCVKANRMGVSSTVTGALPSGPRPHGPVAGAALTETRVESPPRGRPVIDYRALNDTTPKIDYSGLKKTPEGPHNTAPVAPRVLPFATALQRRPVPKYA